MYDFILQLAMVISLGVIVYLLARAIPRVPDEEPTAIRQSYFDRWLESVSLLRLDEKVSRVLANFLRRLRIIVLKFDNLLHRHLTRIREKQTNGSGGNKPDLLEELNKQEE